MYKIISSLLFVAFFASNFAFASNGNPVIVSEPNAPEFMLTLNFAQTGAGEATGIWTSTSGGPYLVTLMNLNTGIRVEHFTTNDETWTFSNLAVKTTYRLTVGDQDLLFDDVLITH
ncbi:MAG: hypothetical protein KA138_04455 [Saprospiraceae bacterium]|jgi:hypothetical protein|nr:hypothetical protein [Lewinellaceae bacterium]MBP6810742.1 hypothetical protein [Saprospiraceae bacterium]